MADTQLINKDDVLDALKDLYDPEIAGSSRQNWLPSARNPRGSKP